LHFIGKRSILKNNGGEILPMERVDKGLQRDPETELGEQPGNREQIQQAGNRRLWVDPRKL
jgi:hypothetical protein